LLELARRAVARRAAISRRWPRNRKRLRTCRRSPPPL